jgi:hypothetical protein
MILTKQLHFLSAAGLLASSLVAQDPSIRLGGEIPAEVDTIYERGLAYLARTQGEDGTWRSRTEHGITGICLMAFLASGEDPNFGAHRHHIRAAVRAIIAGQERDTGFIPNSMYHHGFAMLALAEAYGAIDEETLWDVGDAGEGRQSISATLEKAIALAVNAQKANRWGGWRYSPTSTDADTSVTGCVLMGLLACRNAGITYSRFVEGLKAANIELDRKVLSDIAIRDEAAFTALVTQAQDALKAKATAAKAKA